MVSLCVTTSGQNQGPATRVEPSATRGPLEVPKLDRIVVILSIHLEDEKDVALGRAFCRSEQSAGAMRSGAGFFGAPFGRRWRGWRVVLALRRKVKRSRVV